MEVKKLQVITPAYNESENISKFIEAFLDFRKRLSGKGIDSELLIVNDGSSDNTQNIVESYTFNNAFIRQIVLAGNFGHQAALTAGLMHSDDQADIVVTMDSDLEHPFYVVEDFIGKWNEGFLLVNSIRKTNSKLPFYKRIPSRFFYLLVKWLVGVDINQGSADFRLWDGQLLREIKSYFPVVLSQRVFAAWLPVSKTTVTYEQSVVEGRISRFKLGQNLRLAIDSLIQFSEFPFIIYIIMSTIFLLISMFYAIYIVIMYFMKETVAGWSSLALLIMFFGAINLSGFAIIGTYLSRLQFRQKLPRFVLRRSNKAV
ncbi:MAG: glycosyltransferase family 2 protein [Oligoflexales bacterium]|nr:glycosyltransferase family 2 protein [Oligoflexales bacterium]